MQRAMLPPDAEPLAVPGYYAHATDQTVFGLRFNLYHVANPETHPGHATMQPVCDIMWPRTDQVVYYRAESDYLHTVRPLSAAGGHTAAECGALAETLGLAAILASVYDEPIRDRAEAARRHREEHARQEVERREQRAAELERAREQARKDAEERRARAEAQRAVELERVRKLFELLKWHLEDQFRLKRDGKKSTVFGTIKSIHEGEPWHRAEEGVPTLHAHIRTISERGKPMEIYLREVNWMEIKNPDNPKKYDNIYDAAKEAAQS